MVSLVLVGFNKLEESEIKASREIIERYLEKMKKKADCKELKIRLKMKKHSKSFIHEIEAKLYAEKIFNAKAIDRNLYKAIDSALSKIVSELK